MKGKLVISIVERNKGQLEFKIMILKFRIVLLTMILQLFWETEAKL